MITPLFSFLFCISYMYLFIVYFYANGSYPTFSLRFGCGVGWGLPWQVVYSCSKCWCIIVEYGKSEEWCAPILWAKIDICVWYYPLVSLASLLFPCVRYIMGVYQVACHKVSLVGLGNSISFNKRRIFYLNTCSWWTVFYFFPPLPSTIYVSWKTTCILLELYPSAWLSCQTSKLASITGSATPHPSFPEFLLPNA